MAFAAAMLFFLPGLLSLPAVADSPPTGAGIRLYLEAGTFDPLKDEAPVPDDLRSPDAGPYRIVQFTGPVEERWKEAVAATGAVLFGYLPDYAFIVRMSPMQEQAVERLSFVRWTGAYHPGYKLHPALAGERGAILMNVLFFEDGEGLEYRLRSLGLEVLGRDWLGVRLLADVAFARSIAFLPEAQWIEPIYPPDLLNDNDGRILGVRQSGDGNFTGDGRSLWSYNSSQFEGIATGKGVIVCVQDTGVDGSHQDLSSKKVAYRSYMGGAAWTDQIAHGTHVAGTVLGTGEGQSGKYAGMAPGARLIGIQGISLSGIATESANGESIRWAYDNGADIVTNSWGESSLHGTYGSMAIAYDRAVRDCNSSYPGNQSIIIIFAAGNEAFQGIREPATAKNVITIGATGNNRPLAPDQIAGFSSNGPTNDGRRKPDVMTPGAQVTSCQAATGNQYSTHDGTSMAAPGAAGAAALIVQYYRDNYEASPSPALMKALLANGAEAMSSTYAYPGMGQGFGRINVARTLLGNLTYQVLSEDQKVPLRTDEQMMYNATVLSQDSPLKVMLAWTDPPGSAAAARELVNDLDLEVTSPSGLTYHGNNFTNGESRAGGNPDDLNNLEGFLVKKPEPGTWTIKVTGKNVPSGPQDYAIVFSGDIDVSLDFIDLRVEQGPAASVREVVEGETVNFTAKLRNNGTLPVNGTVACRFSLNGQVIANLSLPAFEANTTKDISTEWVASRGKYILKVEVDPQNLVREKNESNNARQVPLDVLYHGLVVVVTSAELEVEPSAPARFFVSVKNAGTANDTYMLRRTGDGPPPGWNESLPLDEVYINRSSSAELNYTVWPPANATAGQQWSTRLGITSKGNASYAQTVNLTCRTKQVFGMNFTTDIESDFKVDNGERVSCNFTLVNPGNGKDTYAVSYVTVGRSPGWPLNLSMSDFTLSARQRMNLSFFIDIPKNAFANDSVTINVSARSSQSIVQSHKFRAMVRQDYRTELTVDSPADQMAAGASLTYRITVRNAGNGNDTVFFRATAPAGWNASLGRQALYLPARTEATFDLVVANPSSTLAGDHVLNITSTGSGGNTATRLFKVSILQWYKVQVEAAPPNATITQGQSASFTVTVKNLGNGNDSFDLLTLNLPEGWRSAFSNATVELGPGESTDVMLEVATLNTTRPENYTITAKAVSNGRAVVFNFTLLRLELLEAPKPPPPPPPPPPPVDPMSPGGGFPWLWALLLMVAIIAAAGGVAGYAVHRSRKRDAWQPTDDARVAQSPAGAQPMDAHPPIEGRSFGAYPPPADEPPLRAYEPASTAHEPLAAELIPAHEPAGEPEAPLYESGGAGSYGLPDQGAQGMEDGSRAGPFDGLVERPPSEPAREANDTGPLFERPDYQPEEPDQAPGAGGTAAPQARELPPPPPPGYRADAPRPPPPPPPRPPSRSQTDALELDDVMERIRRLSQK
jgi:uncharacterized membrane protein/subtilisin family serine protease